MGRFIRKTREEREDEILSAAIKVFLEKGYRETTMEDIVIEFMHCLFEADGTESLQNGSSIR